MDTVVIRQKLHQFIDAIEDTKAEAIYTLFANDMDTESQRKALIQAERLKYLNGIGSSYSIEEVKKMAMNKELRNGLQH